jgi:uncharacterized membrane protein
MGEAINPWLHILAATILVGPQFFLFIAAIPAIRTVEDAQARARAMRVVTTRFGYLAWGAIIVLIITGIGNLYEIAPVDADKINDLNYGTIFMVKMTLLVIVIVLMALHSFVLGPRLMRMTEQGVSEEQLASVRRISMIVSGVNLLLTLGIIFCAAMLHTDFALKS